MLKMWCRLCGEFCRIAGQCRQHDVGPVLVVGDQGSFRIPDLEMKLTGKGMEQGPGAGPSSVGRGGACMLLRRMRVDG